MKKFITLCAFLISLNAFSQITITNADMPVANDTVRLSTTFDQWSIDPTLTGANYTWDYSFLTETTQELDTFFAVTTTPFAYQFFFNNQILYPSHKASFATRGIDFDLFGVVTMTNVFDFFKVDAGQYSNVGFGANINGIPASVRSIPVDTIFKFPLDYTDTYTSHGEWIMSIPNTFTYGQRKVRDVNVEGWGTLITPLGTFQTLKVKMDIDIIDTLSVDSLSINFSFPRPTATEYHWLANGYNVPLLQINTSFGNITTIKYQDSLRTNLGIPEEESLNIITYPNPTSDYLVVQSDGKYFFDLIELYDMNGKLVLSQIGNNTFINILNVNHLANGMYNLVTTSEKSVSTKKITVSR
jgi:hypothetical protein